MLIKAIWHWQSQLEKTQAAGKEAKRRVKQDQATVISFASVSSNSTSVDQMATSQSADTDTKSEIDGQQEIEICEIEGQKLDNRLRKLKAQAALDKLRRASTNNGSA